MLSADSKSLLELSQIKAEGQNGVDGSSSNKDVLRLPGFQQAFGSTEIGRFSQHEGFFETTLPQPEVPPETKVSTTPQNTNKRTRNPRGSRKNKNNNNNNNNSNRSLEGVEKNNWPQEQSLQCLNQPMKKESWPEMNSVMPQMPMPMSMSMQSMAMNNQVRTNCYPYQSMDDQQNYGQQWPHPTSHPSLQPPMMQDPNCYYQHQHHNHQYCQPYYNNQHQQETPLTSPGHTFHPDYGDPFYPQYPPQNWRNHPYYNQHHFPHQSIPPLPPPYMNQQYNDMSPYRHCSAGTTGYQNHNRSWVMNRDFKIHNYSSGIV